MADRGALFRDLTCYHWLRWRAGALEGPPITVIWLYFALKIFRTLLFHAVLTLRGPDVTYSETSIWIYMGVFILGVICDLHIILYHFALSHICDNCPERVNFVRSRYHI